MRVTDELDLIKKRLDIVEETIHELAEIKDTLDSIARWIKAGIPSVVSALIAAGIVNGQMGAFLRALVGN